MRYYHKQHSVKECIVCFDITLLKEVKLFMNRVLQICNGQFFTNYASTDVTAQCVIPIIFHGIDHPGADKTRRNPINQFNDPDQDTMLQKPRGHVFPANRLDCALHIFFWRWNDPRGLRRIRRVIRKRSR